MAHQHAHHEHDHSGGRLGIGLVLTLAFAAVEAGVGLWANSLALLGDAGHMLTDAGALALAAVAAYLARRPATKNHSYGMGRLEVVAALINVLFMLAVVAGIVYHAVQRLSAPMSVHGPAVMVVAAIGLVLNLALLRILSQGHGDLNTRGAALHVLGDLMGSIAALTSGLVIWATGWTPIDPLLSLVICMLILIASIRVLGRALRVIMEGVPPHLDLEDIGLRLAKTDGVHSVHDLHIWNLSSNEVALSAHVVLSDMRSWPQVLSRLQETLAREYAIHHATLQPEPPEEIAVPMPAPPGGTSKAPG